ncbi:MAG: ABC transporter permease subunit [Treponema sp.]|nr:ABC transporter permease subunit [Treponema sp.]
MIIALKDFRVRGGFINSVVSSAWVGLKNFNFLFSNNVVWMVIRNTLAYNAVMIVLGIVIPVTLAIIVSEIRNKTAAKIYQTIMFFPFFLSWVVVSAIVMAFLSYEMGIVNRLLAAMGKETHLWYREVPFWPPFLVFISQWKGMGYGMVIYLAAISSQDREIYEAAIIDGATKWQQIWRITLPLLKTIIILMFILSAGRIFYSDFGLFYQVPRNSGALYNTVYTIDVFVYHQLKASTIGMASASALLQSAVSCVMILAVNQIVRKIDPDSAMI